MSIVVFDLPQKIHTIQADDWYRYPRWISWARWLNAREYALYYRLEVRSVVCYGSQDGNLHSCRLRAVNIGAESRTRGAEAQRRSPGRDGWNAHL